MARFTKEDAKAMSILDVARSLGMELEQNSNQEWYWVEHDSLKINTRKNRFDWYSRDIHGDVINLVETIKEVDYKQAMHYLRTGAFPQAKMNQPVKEPFNYVLGRFEQPFIEARDYLKEVRGLSDDTINFFGQAGVLAQANKKAPDDYLEPVVVFKSFDKDKQVIGASLQGIVPNKERYEGKGYLKQIAYNSDGLSGMSVDIGTPRRLVFAEAPIDLMSYYEANKGNLSDVRLVAMDGLKAGTVSRYTLELLAELQGKADYKPDLSKVGEALEKLTKVTTFFQDGKNSDLITLAVDNDKAGTDFIEQLQAKGIPVQPDLPPLPEGATKMDWNDYLKSQKAGMVLEDNLPRDNSRLAQAERKLERLSGELVEKADKVYAHTRQANGQPMNDKRGGSSFFRKQDQLEGAIFTKLDEIKKQEERVEKLRYQRDLKERGFNKQGSGLVMSVDNIPRIKDAIEAFEKGEPGFTRATINRYRKELVKLEAMKERLEDIRISPGAQHLIDEGLVTQWQKQPTLYFVKGLRKVAFELAENGEFQLTQKYLARDAEAVERVTELLDQQTTINNEKEQNMAIEHESETMAQATEPRFELEASELGRPEQPITNFDELQMWMLQQFNSVFVGEGYFKTYLQVYSLDENGQEVASQIRFDVGHGQSDFNPRREHIRDYLVEHGYIQIDNSSLSMTEIEKEQSTSPRIQELLGQVEDLGQTAYFWVTEEDLGQSKEIVAQLDNWFSSGKVDSTYKSDIFELVAGDYTYMIEFRDGSISLQNMEDYSQYISNRIEEFGIDTVIPELESVIQDFNQMKASITAGMNKELDTLSATLERVGELLDQQTTINNEKEQDMELAHESETPTLKALYSSEIFSDKPQVVEYLKEWSADATEVSQIMESLSKLDPNRSDWLTPVQYHLDEMRREQQRKNIEQDKLEYGSESAELYHSREFQDKPIVVQWLKDNNATENELRELLPLIRELNIEGWLNPEWKTLVQERLVGLRSPYMVRFNWSENLGGSPNPLKDFSEGDLIPYAEFISVLYRRNEYSSDRGYERTSFDIISPDGEVIISDFRYDTGSEVRTIAEKLEDSELAKIEEANKEPYKLLAAIDKHLEIPANISLPEVAIDAISTQYGENSPVLPEAEEKMLDWLEQRYPPTSEYFLELHRGFGVAGLKSTLTYDTWEQYIADSPLPETELTKEVEQRTERLIQVRNEIKERLQSEFVPALLQEIQKAPEQAQGQEKNAEGTIGDFPDKQGAAPLPEATKSQPLNDLSPNQTQPQPLLHFSINEERKSIKKRGYHPASDRDLVKLNRYSTSLKEVAQWYLRELSESTIHYIYKDNEGVNSLQVTFDKDKFIHLTGIFPYKEGYSADKLLIDFANGQGSFDDILLANKGAAFDKLKVLPELPAIIEANSFYFDDLSDVPKLHSLDMDKAIKSGDEDIVLALRTVDGETFPASLMKLRSGLRNQLDNAEEKTILGIYRERDGVIEQLSINDEYVKDEGREFLSILENRQFEPIHDVSTMSLQERFTSLLDGVREFGAEHFRGREGEEFTKFFQLYAQAKENIDQTIKLGLGEKLVNLDSSFYKEWIDDRLHETAGISSVDVLSGRITSTEYQQQIERLYQTYLQQVTPKVEQTEIRIDSDADGLTDKEEIGKGQNPLGDSVPDQAIIANDEPSRVASQKEPAEERTVAQMVAELDTKALSIHLKEGVKNYLNSDQYKNFLTAMSKLHHYSPRNLQLLLAQNPDVSVVASFKKWKEDYGRTVNKGEKSLRVWAPVQVVRKDKISGEPMLDDNGKVIKDTVFKLVPVFDISQTSGKEFPTPVNVLEGKHEDYANLYRAAKQVASDNGVTISISDTSGKSRGYYSPMENKIVLQRGMSEQQTLKTLFHEMAHSDLHNLDAKATQDFTRSTKELQAESVAYVVASHYGFDTSEYSFGYLANWTEDAATLSDLEAQLAIIQKEANSLIQRLDQSLEKVVSKTLSADKFTERLSQFKDETKNLQSGLDKESKKNQPSLNLDQQMK
ncbi:PBECR4 domain-containing protein [Streptococcus suis]|uniref:PBECR4 domain-containing protein n=1 Tax=Streptococcus suis TaxID=1307 RepID=UPI000CF50927|nr:PBECR4 domain-containing protein [Streptococcus suis]